MDRRLLFKAIGRVVVMGGVLIASGCSSGGVKVAPQATTESPAAVSGSSRAAPSGSTPAPMAVSISISEYKYTPASFSLRVGQPVTVNAANVGQINHTFSIDGLVDTGKIAGGTSNSVQFTPTQAGTLIFYCLVHGPDVMKGTITVTAQ